MRQYYTYILNDPTVNGCEGICVYYCYCIQGRRNVGGCAHVASMIYYILWARHQKDLQTPAGFLDVITIVDNEDY